MKKEPCFPTPTPTETPTTSIEQFYRTGSILANDVSNNISEIDVIDQTEFEKGNVIVIDRGTSIEEFNEVVGIDPLLLKNPLRFNHTKFAPVEILVAKECCPQFNLSSDFTDGAFADLNEVSGTSTIDGTLCWNEFNSFKPLPSTYILTFGVNDFSEGSILLSVKHNILPSNNSIRFVDENGTCWYGKLETTTAYNICIKYLMQIVHQHQLQQKHQHQLQL